MLFQPFSKGLNALCLRMNLSIEANRQANHQLLRLRLTDEPLNLAKGMLLIARDIQRCIW